MKAAQGSVSMGMTCVCQAAQASKVHLPGYIRFDQDMHVFSFAWPLPFMGIHHQSVALMLWAFLHIQARLGLVTFNIPKKLEQDHAQDYRSVEI